MGRDEGLNKINLCFKVFGDRTGSDTRFRDGRRTDTAAVRRCGCSAAKTPAPARQPSYIRDHRKRLRQRFLQGGAAALPDYELLELVLFRAIPRQDVKPLARQLLERFGDFNHVLSAGLCQLSQVPGVGDAVICELKIVEAAAHRLSQSKVIRRPVVSGWDALVAYCRTTMAHRETEQFRVLYLDLKNVLIADEL